MREIKKNNLVWIDLEMTGLDIERCRIIEIAAVITDSDLNIIAETPGIAIYQKEADLKNMNLWCKRTHNNSGLIKRVKESIVVTNQAEEIILKFIKKYVDKSESPLCGNSVWQDRRFLAKYMPVLESYLNYRLLDVSTFKVSAALWRPDLLQQFNKKNSHIAIDDIKDSIKEMKFYRKNYLIRI